MENELITTRDDQVAPRREARDELLESLAKKANEAHARLVMSVKAGMLAAVEAGLALAEAKRVCPLRRWRQWLADNFEGSYRTADRYLEFAKQFNLAGGADVTGVSHLAPHETDEILARLLAVSRGKKEAKAATRLEHQAAPTPTDAPPQLSAPQPTSGSSMAQPSASATQSSAHQTSAPQPSTPKSSATRLPQYQTYAPRPSFPLANTVAPPPRYERPATDPLLRAEQLLDETMMALRRVTDFPDKVDAEEGLRELAPIHARLVRHNQERRRRLLAAGYVLR